MGMDVYGRKPTSETGSYFRNNVWWWRPLANFIENEYSDDIARISKIAWHTNDGEGLGKRDSLKLAKLIRRDLANGTVAEYEKKYNDTINSAPEIPCDYCKGTGKRAWAKPGVKTQKIEALAALAAAPGTPGEGAAAQAAIERLGGSNMEIKTCNGCSGTGKDKPFWTNYPFSKENVQEFADFLEACGGFKIC